MDVETGYLISDNQLYPLFQECGHDRNLPNIWAWPWHSRICFWRHFHDKLSSGKSL